VLGAYDPIACGCDESDFINAAHPKDSCLGRILGPWAASLVGTSSN
jgi:hypothetical protein